MLVFIHFQVQGLGTALKILFSGQFDVKIDPGNPDPNFKLRRGEIVSLFNAFGRYFKMDFVFLLEN